MGYLEGILLFSVIVGLIGIGAYTNEVVQGRVDRYTTWGELTDRQWFFIVAAIAGFGMFIATIFIGTAIK